MIQRWGDAFGDRFRVFLYDDLVLTPVSFLKGIEEHIGVSSFSNPQMLDRRSNADTKGTPMPPELHARLVEIYSRDIELLEQAVPSIGGRWQNFLE
jgi:hypothetical protein